MQPAEQRDPTLLLDMLTAARKCIAFTEDHTFESLRDDEQLQLASLRLIQIVGEAARHVSDQRRIDVPEVPWAEIIGMRHRLVHDYGGIHLPTVWKTIKQDLPELVAVLERQNLEPPA